MIKVKKCYDNIGMLDTRVSSFSIINGDIIIPVSNIQIDDDFELNVYDKIAYIDYSYIYIKGVYCSEREVYYNGNTYEKFHHKNILNVDIDKFKTQIYEFEFIDFINPSYQYWWTIEALDLEVWIPIYGSILENYTPNDKLRKDHFFCIDTNLII